MRPYTYCGLCNDAGAVTIWHPDTLTSLQRGDEPPRKLEAAVACKCKRGAAFRHRMQGGQSVKWLDTLGDRDWHCRRTIRDRATSGSIFDPLADVIEFGTEKLQRFIDGKPANYVDAFDEFNAGGA